MATTLRMTDDHIERAQLYYKLALEVREILTDLVHTLPRASLFSIVTKRCNFHFYCLGNCFEHRKNRHRGLTQASRTVL
jgi:hypothetical protein